MVTVVTIILAAGAVSKIPSQSSQSSQPSHNPKRSPRPRLSIRRLGAGLWTAAVQYGSTETLVSMPLLMMWYIVGNGQGSRRSRIPPRRAHDTLQPQDESIIVGYYTSAEVFPATYVFQKSKFRRYFAYGKRRRY